VSASVSDLFHTLRRSCIAAVIAATVTTGSSLLTLDMKKSPILQLLKELPIF